jgi:hypothetical protein
LRRSPLRAPLVGLVCATALLAVPAESQALIVGLGDQKPSTFSDPLFQALKVKRTRYIVPWNAVQKPDELAEVDAWMAAARAARLEIMVAFNLDSGAACPESPCTAPSVSSYRTAVRAFHRRYPFVRIYQPWNESNSRTQPTTGPRGARLVARYYKTLRSVCRRCLVTGADIQDIGDFVGYTRAFLRALGRRPPTVMGFHNYTDTNRFKFESTQKFVRVMPRRTKVWLTETGGLFRFTQQDGTVSLAPDENRAARSIGHMFKIARKFRSKIDRIYVYQWSAAPSDRFDAGVVNPDGTPRKSYYVLKRNRRYIR